jgi:hypothetical protein
LPCLKHTIPGIAEDFERDQVVIVCAWCFDARELAANFLMGDIRNRTSKRKAVEEPLISISGALAPALLFVLNEELYGLTVRSVCGRTFPRVNSARSLRASGHGQSKSGVLSNRVAAVPVLQNEGFGPSLRDSTTEQACLK